MGILKDVSNRITNKLRLLNLHNMNNSNKKYPIADGSFIQADMVEKWNDSKWQSEFNYLKEVNMHYVIMSTSTTEGGLTKTIYPTKIPRGQMEYPSVDIVDMCLRNAEKTGMKIFLGINFNSEWLKKGPRDPHWLYAQMERGNLIADELYTKYYYKYPNAFHGWYWVYEVDNLNFKTKDDFSVLAKAININLKHLKGKRHPLPFMLSPFMNSIYGKAEEYAKNWAYLFQHTDLGKGDIFCPQDSVGGGGLKIDQVDQWFKELRKAVDGKPGLLFWANTETFNHLNWSSVPLNQFVRQMEIEKPYVDNIMTFAYCHYYSPNNIDKGFHETYLNYVKSGGLENRKPTPPKEVKVKKDGGSKFLVSWLPARDNIGIYGYEVYRNKKLIFTTNVDRIFKGKTGKKEGLVMSYIDKVPLRDKFKWLNYEVRAVDFAGNISKSKKARASCIIRNWRNI